MALCVSLVICFSRPSASFTSRTAQTESAPDSMYKASSNLDTPFTGISQFKVAPPDDFWYFTVRVWIDNFQPAGSVIDPVARMVRLPPVTFNSIFGWGAGP